MRLGWRYYKYMSLTHDDLQAIRGIVKQEITVAIEESDQRTAAGFAAVDEQFRQIRLEMDEMKADINDLKATTARIASVQLAEIDRNNQQDAAIIRIRKHLHAV